MKSTRDEIIKIADELIRTKGYNAFSYSDISERLKIKNASIHYYFPSKSDLGVAVIQNSIIGFQNMTNSWSETDIKSLYERFIKMHDYTQRAHSVCLIGALSSSVDTLSDNMKRELKKMGNIIINYLTDLLVRGKEENIFSFSEEPRTKALLIQSTLLASLLLDKVFEDTTYIEIQDTLLSI